MHGYFLYNLFIYAGSKKKKVIFKCFSFFSQVNYVFYMTILYFNIQQESFLHVLYGLITSSV